MTFMWGPHTVGQCVMYTCTIMYNNVQCTMYNLHCTTYSVRRTACIVLYRTIYKKCNLPYLRTARNRHISR